MSEENNPVHLRRLLRKYALEINFTKKNGEERIMNCTLNMKGVPQEEHPKGTGGKEKEDDHPHINVYDLDKGEWRSFHAPSVNSVVVKDTIDD